MNDENNAKSLLITDMFVLFNASYISNINYGNRLTLGLSGAILMDLMVHKKIELKGNKITLIETSKTEEPFLDEAISFLLSLKKNKRIKYYLKNFLHTGIQLFPLFIRHLEQLNLMRITFSERNLFGRAFKYFTVDYVNNDKFEEVIDILKKILLEDSPVPNKSIWYLISLLRATNGYSNFFGKEFRSQVKSKIKKIIIDEPIGKKVKLEINAAEATDSGSGD